jgi:hypothetical protein
MMIMVCLRKSVLVADSFLISIAALAAVWFEIKPLDAGKDHRLTSSQARIKNWTAFKLLNDIDALNLVPASSGSRQWY